MKLALKIYLIGILFLVPCLTSEAAFSKKLPWIDKLFYCVAAYLDSNDERTIIRNSKRYKLTDADIEKSIFYSWEASGLNPAWWGRYDGRKLGCIRILVAHYGETSFNLYAVNDENTNGSVDIGAMQINSVHWFCADKGSMWVKFCDKNGLNPRNIYTILNPRNNFRFAGTLNEHFLRTGQRSYRYDGQARQRKFYAYLLKRMDMNSELYAFLSDSERPLTFADKN